MLVEPQPPRIQLPKGCQACVKSAVLHAIALAHYTIVYARAWAASSINARVRLAAESRLLGPFRHLRQRKAWIAFVVFQCSSGGHLEESAL